MKTVSSSKSLTINNKLCTINRETNSLGIDTFTTTEDETGNQISATDGNGNTVNYSYDDINNLVKMSQEVDETNLEVNYTYDNRGNISAITNGNVTYTYKYTPFGDLKSISVGNTPLLTYTYESNQNRVVTKVTYANGQSFNYSYNNSGMLTKAVSKDSSNNVTNTLTYVNDETGETLKTIDAENGTVTLSYLDETQVWNAAETELLYSYSSTDEKYNEYVNGTKFTTTYSSTDNTDEKTDLTTTETTAFGNMTKTVYSDTFGRVLKEETKNGSTVVMLKEYTYNTNGNYITDRVNTEKTTIGGNSYLYHKYTYDNNGNITSIENLHSNGVKDVYEYDELGQLVKENSTTFEYDNYGNITKKGGFTYYYEDNNWKDKLTKRVSQTITYDESGNPLTYLGATLTWKNGRQLASYTKGTTNVTYEYNESGLRTQKNVNKNGTITTYNYIWSDDKLTHQSWDNKYLHFYYDNSGEIVGFEYFDGTSAADYTYMKNMQGDVLCIVDDTGARVAQYSYDAWGKLNTFSGGIGLINPIRYRGYYYDTEISMYYLQSRYYNPAVGRFINADDTKYVDLVQRVLSYNIFTYTENNPISFFDLNGNWKISGKNSIATSEKGDNLKKLAKMITGDEKSWKKLGFKKENVKKGIKINIKELKSILYKNTIKKLNDNYDNNNPITAKFKNNTLHIYVKPWFHNFNNKYIDCVKKAIKKWAKTYKNVLGKKIEVKIHIKEPIIITVDFEKDKLEKYEIDNYSSNYLNFVLDIFPEGNREWPFVSVKTLQKYSGTDSNKRIVVFLSSKSIQSYKDFILQCKHEFGHCLFLSDSYNYTKEFNGYKSINNPGEKYGFQLCKNDGKKYFHDVMSCNCDPQERDIAMVIFGFAENKEQHYVTKKTGEKISNALKFFY